MPSHGPRLYPAWPLSNARGSAHFDQYLHHWGWVKRRRLQEQTLSVSLELIDRFFGLVAYPKPLLVVVSIAVIFAFHFVKILVLIAVKSSSQASHSRFELWTSSYWS